MGEAGPEVAARLIGRFGSIGQMMNASAESLQAALADTPSAAAAIIAARDLMQTGLREHLTSSRIDPDSPELHRYLAVCLSSRTEEVLHAIFLDPAQQFIRDERIASGSAHGIALRIRPLLQRALDLGAAKLIIAHNHPSGVARASKADVQATAELKRIAAALDVELLDHCIVGGAKVFSMRREGLM